MSQFPTLFSPVDVGHRRLKNRICCSAHADSLAVDGMPGDAARRYYELKAKGGVGFMMCFGSASVHPSSPGKDWNGVELFEDKVIPYLQKFSHAMEAYGVPCVSQITHRGRRGRSIDTFERLYAPSAVREPNHREVPHAITDESLLEEFVKSYADAAWRLKEGGFAGCEVMASHGHLIDQFWSLNANKREDQYGGSLDNRLRFGIRVLEAVRDRVGSDFIMGIRMTGDDFVEGGLTNEDCCEIAARLDELGLIDYFNIIGGSAETYLGEAICVPNMAFPLATYKSLSAAIRENVKAPVIATGRINDPTLAEKILQEGQADLCIMNRALIADPDFPNKAKDGQPEDIRQCMGYNTGCIDRIYTGLGVTCVQNAVIGREKEWSVLLKSQEKKKVVIVGGGPAGLECARVARMRGHTVILFEKGDELGGQTLIARNAPSRQDFDGACRYAAQQCEKLRVEIRLSTPATVESILAESPDAVVLATGAKAFRPPIPGLEDFGYSAWEVLQGEDVSGDRILVLDEQYGYHAPSVAEYLLDRGKEVDIITSEPSIVGLLGDTTRPPVLQRLFTKGVQVRGFLRALYLEGSEVIAENVWSHAEESVGDYDAVVYAYGGQAVDEMRERLLESVSTVEMVGDCFAPRSLQHAIYDGHKFGREL